MSPGPLGELYAGVHAENPDALTDTPPQRPIYGDRTDATGNLAQLSPEAAAKALVKLWDEREKMYGRDRAQWQVNAWRREGIVHAEVQRAQDRDEWIAWRWGGGIPHLNKAATLCRKLAATVWADLPVAVVAADTGEDADRDAAQFSERVLHFLQDAAQLDDITQARRAFDLASTYGSTFRHYYLEPRGERLPIQIEATASAQSAQEPFGPGQVVPAEPLVLRYVQPDGSLRDDKAGAAEHWVPRLCSELLTPYHVRLLPATAEDIGEAEGVLIASYQSLGTLRTLYPDAVAQSFDGRPNLGSRFRRADKYLWPGRSKEERSGFEQLKGEQQLLFTLRCYYRQCPLYPEGLRLIVAGEDTLLDRGPWVGEVKGLRQPLDLPVVQYNQFSEGRAGPYRVGLMELIGGGHEILAGQLGALMEYLDRFAEQKYLLPYSSMIRPEDLQQGSKSVLYFNPGGKPEVVPTPVYPPASLQAYELASVELDHISGLEQTAQGVEDPSITSGRHAFAVIGQAHVALSEVRQEAERAFVRGCHIILQQVWAHYQTPRRLAWTAPDGRYLEKRWSGADLRTVQDIRIKPGSMSMLAPAAKLAQIIQWGQIGALGPAQIRRAVHESMGALTAAQEDPARQRIRRQLAIWEEGPPPNWDPNLVAAGVMPDAAGQIWAPVPADLLPTVAPIRLEELADAMAGVTYQQAAPAWRQALDLEFGRMWQAASGQPTQTQAPGQAAAPAPAVQPIPAEQAAETQQQAQVETQQYAPGAGQLAPA